MPQKTLAKMPWRPREKYNIDMAGSGAGNKAEAICHMDD